MLCSFPNSVPWSKLVRGLKTYLCFIGLCWRGLDLVSDAKNICRKIKKFPGPCANVCADSASSRSDQLDQSYLVRDQNWFWPHLLSTARSLNVFRAFKSKDTSTDEDEGQNTKSKKTFSFSIIFKERKMVTPTRIIQKNCSRISTCCTQPPPPPSPPPPLRKRDSRELDFAWTTAMPAPACSYWLNGILHMMSF